MKIVAVTVWTLWIVLVGGLIGTSFLGAIDAYNHIHHNRCILTSRATWWMDHVL